MVGYHALRCKKVRLVTGFSGVVKGLGEWALVPASIFIFRATVENTFMSSLVRIQAERKQRVISRECCFVRTSLVSGCVLMMFWSPLLLGSIFGP